MIWEAEAWVKLHQTCHILHFDTQADRLHSCLLIYSQLNNFLSFQHWPLYSVVLMHCWQMHICLVTGKDEHISILKSCIKHRPYCCVLCVTHKQHHIKLQQAQQENFSIMQWDIELEASSSASDWDTQIQVTIPMLVTLKWAIPTHSY